MYSLELSHAYLVFPVILGILVPNVEVPPPAPIILKFSQSGLFDPGIFIAIKSSLYVTLFIWALSSSNPGGCRDLVFNYDIANKQL